MKILQCINALTFGGAQVLTADLARAARSAGHKVMVAAFRDGPIGGMLRQEGFDVHILGEELFDSIALWRLRHLWREFKPDIVHSHLSRATFWVRLLAKRQPETSIITSVHGFESERFHVLEKSMAKISDCLIFPSRFLMDWYDEHIRKLPQHRTLLIYPGVAACEQPPERHFEPKSPIRIGSLCRLHRIKGLDILLKACALLNDNFDFQIIIGGLGKELPTLHELANQLGIAEKVEWDGSITSPKKFLSTLDIFAAPSREEAFGITICEAMERSLPIVASKVGGIPEIVRHGIDGFLTAPEQIHEFAAALAALLDNADLRRKMGASGRARVQTFFKRDSCLSKHLEIYTKLYNLKSRDVRRVHMAVSSNELGGGERMAAAMAEAMIHRGIKITATCSGDPLASRLKAYDIPVSTSSMRAGGLFFALKLIRDVKVHHPQIINTHLNKAAMAAGILRTLGGPPVISHVHGLNRAVYYRHSDKLIAVSNAVGRYLTLQGIAKEKIFIVPNSIPEHKFTYEIAPGPPWVIGITAKLHANKGHEWALKALAQNWHRLPQLGIELFGDGPEREAIYRLINASPLKNHVKLRGFQCNMNNWYPKLHVMLLPSRSEGIPLSLLEAMSWGIPCIATNVGGIPEIIENGFNGILIKPGDEEGLIEALNNMLSVPAYERFRKAASERFCAINDFDGLIERFIALCKN